MGAQFDRMAQSDLRERLAGHQAEFERLHLEYTDRPSELVWSMVFKEGFIISFLHAELAAYAVQTGKE